LDTHSTIVLQVDHDVSPAFVQYAAVPQAIAQGRTQAIVHEYGGEHAQSGDHPVCGAALRADGSPHGDPDAGTAGVQGSTSLYRPACAVGQSPLVLTPAVVETLTAQVSCGCSVYDLVAKLLACKLTMRMQVCGVCGDPYSSA
jgi:hypothetical protein